MATLKPLDTELATVGFRSVSYADSFTPTGSTPTNNVNNSKSPITPKSGNRSIYSRAPASAYPRTPTGEPPIKMLGRRTTTRNFDVDQTEALAYDDGEDALSKMGKYLHKVHSASVLTRYSLYILPVAILLAIPMIVTASPPYDDKRADGIRLLGLFIWIEIIWLALWVGYLKFCCPTSWLTKISRAAN